MKILLAAPQPFYEERGTPIAVRWVAEALCKAGHQVDLLCYHRGQDIEVDGLRIIRAWGPSRIKHIKIGFSWQKILCDIFLAARMRRLMRENRYDVVHAVEEAVFPAMLLRNRKTTPLVFDMDSSMPDQIMEKWPFLKGLAGAMNYFEKKAVKAADLILPVCETLKRKVDSYGPTGRVCVLHDRAQTGDDSAEPEDLRQTLNVQGCLLLYVGNLEHYQGIDLVLHAARLIRTEKDWTIVFIGGRDSDIRKYRHMAEELNLSAHILFPGPRPVGALPMYLAQADVLLSPRIKGENTPLKVYSYMLAGKPIIATDILSHTQVLDRDCAVIAAPEEQAYAHAMQHLIEEPASGQAVAGNAREKALAHHTEKAYENTLLSAYTFDMFGKQQGSR